MEGLEERTLLSTATLTNLSISPYRSEYGQPVVLTATVTSNSGTPTGVVQFQVDGSSFGSAVTLVNGVASLSDTLPTLGNHTVHAFFTDTSGSFGASQDGLSSAFINTLAGNGYFGYGAGYSGDGAAASLANLASANAVAVDSSGNIYIADTGNHRIREIVKATGNIITVAGNGNQGFLGDGGAATNASLDSPRGICIDTVGNLYFTDSGNRIRELVRSTGTIITVVGNGTYGFSGDGGSATDASLDYPAGISLDSDGNLFIADSANGRIREVVKATGNIITVAGNGYGGFAGDGGAATNAQLSDPKGITIDSSGNLFIADTYNNRIREVIKATGIIITVAGNGSQQFGGDGGAATNASLSNPKGILVDSAGNLFIADTNNHRVREVVKATGNIITVAGNGLGTPVDDNIAATSTALNSPTGLAMDSDGNLYVADPNNSRIREVVKATGNIITVAGITGDGGPAANSSVNLPSDVAFDSLGNLYIADSYNNRIREVVKATGNIITVAGTGIQGFGGDGGPATSAALNNPGGIAFDSDDNLYIADYYNERIREVVKATGNIITVAGGSLGSSIGDGGAATSARLSGPQGLAIDSIGNLYIADSGQGRIREVVKATGIIMTVAGNGTAGFSGDGGAATNASLYEPNGVAVDSSGNLFIADTYNNRIREVVKATGNILTFAGNGTAGFSGDGGAATLASLYHPQGITVDSSGNLYISDEVNGRIREVINAMGTIITVAGSDLNNYWTGDGGPASNASLDYPQGVALDSTGSLYIADSFHSRIRATLAPSFTVTAASTWSWVSATPSSPSVFGQNVTLTATIRTYNPSTEPITNGTVQFLVDGVNYGSAVSLINGVAQLISNTLSVGSHSIYAVYVSDSANFKGSTSPVITQTVTAGTTPTTGLSISPITSVYGQPVVMTATVPAGATGTVTFNDGSTPLGTATISGSQATFTTSTLAGGVHSISASYNGDGNFPASISSVLTQTVNQASSTTTLLSSLNPSVYGNSVTFTATVTSGATGTVTFKDGPTTLGTATIRGSQATFTTSTLVIGSHSISASYRGDGNFAGSISGVLTQTVNQASSTTTLISSLNPSVYGNSVTFTATVTAGATGTVTFNDGPITLGTAAISGGQATFTTSTLVIGSHTITAVYSGDGNFLGGISPAVHQTVNSLAITTTTLLVSPITPVYGQPVELTATVTSPSGTPTGGVQFQINGSNFGTPVSLVNGVASLTIPTPNPGACVIHASYLGDGTNYTPSSDGTGQITTVINTESSDGGMATERTLNHPSAVAVDGAGNLFISDPFKSSIREVFKATGVMITVAGTGKAGFSGDGGAATDAMLNDPEGLAVDSVGNLFIVDSRNQRIREVIAATGQIVTVAGGSAGNLGDGGPATQAALDFPSAVAVDTVGNLFIADTFNNRIRKVSAATGFIETIAGNGYNGFGGDGGPATAATINDPSGVAVDGAGNVFISDSMNNRVREVVAATGNIITVAGNGSSGFGGDGGNATDALLYDPVGIAVDGSGNLFIADSDNQSIREVVSATGVIVTVAGSGPQGGISVANDAYGDGGPATDAVLAYVQGVAVDSVGNLFIADSDHNRIREVIHDTGTIIRVAGTGFPIVSLVNGPFSMATDSAGNLFFANFYEHRVEELVKSTGALLTVAGTGLPGYSGDGGAATDALLAQPSGVAIDADGNIFIADQVNQRIREVLKATGEIITVAGNGTNGFDGDGGAATDASISYPSGLVVDTAGNLFFADNGNSRIRVVLAFTGTIITVAGVGTDFHHQDGSLATETLFLFPCGEAIDGAGDLLIADSNNSRICKVNLATELVTTVAGNGYSGFAGDGGPATLASLSYCNGLSVDSAGNLFIADRDNNRIREVLSGTGHIITIAGDGSYGYAGDGDSAIHASVSYPNCVVTDREGNLFIDDQSNGRIRKVSPSIILDVSAASTSTTLVSSQSPSLYGQSVTFTATVKAEAPSTATATGMVQFQVDGVNFGSPVNLVDGVATFTTSTLTLGAHSITAQYAGDASKFTSSTAPAISQTVTAPGAAAFVKLDSTTQGNWKNAYGADGFDLSQDSSANNPSIPAYATVSVTSASGFTWNSSTTDPRALQKATPGATDRLAATWYSNTSFTIDIHINDGQTHQVALYALDWDTTSRTESIQLIDDATGSILDTRSLSSFHAGAYLVWNIQGDISFKVTSTGNSPNAVLSGLFFGGAPLVAGQASFLKADVSTQGTWKTAYGADGYAISQDPSDNNPSFPSYANVQFKNASNAVWSSFTPNSRALLRAAHGSTDHIAAAWYSSSSFSIDVQLTDGQTHQVGLYALDWDTTSRTQTIQVIDDASGAVLDSRDLAGFHNGTYLVWNIRGSVTFRVLNTNSGSNAVLSGLFFGAAPGGASFVQQDITTQGNWKAFHGADGFDICQDPSANNPSIPAYASLSISGAQAYAWSSSTSDPRALQLAASGSGNRLAASWYHRNSFSVNVTIGDGQSHEIALYVLDWDHAGRSEMIQVVDSATGSILDTRLVSNFDNGVYEVWNIQGNVTFKITNTSSNPNSTNAVLSGVFFGGAPVVAGQATYVKQDTSTQGTWKGVYGHDGSDLSQDVSGNNPTVPSYASLAVSQATDFLWNGSTTDSRALQKSAVGSTDRLAGTWYSSDSFTLSVAINDGKTHQVALYAMDWDNAGRSELIQVIDTATGGVLDSRTVSGFRNGVYLVWNISGNVSFRVVNTGSSNAVISGLFFG